MPKTTPVPEELKTRVRECAEINPEASHRWIANRSTPKPSAKSSWVRFALVLATFILWPNSLRKASIWM